MPEPGDASPDIAFAFELDPALESYGPGAPVTGKLRVRSARDVIPESLSLRLVTLTEPSQVPRPLVHGMASLPVERWRSGETRTFDIAFAIPEAPAYSHEGEALSLRWYVEAEAQVLWEVNTVARHPLRVVPHEGWRLDVGVARASAPKVRRQEVLLGVATTLLVVMAVVAWSPPAFLGASLCLLPLAGFLAPMLVYRAYWKRVGRPGVTLRVEPSDEGYRTSDSRDHLACTLTVPGRVPVQRAKATLVVRESEWLGTTSSSVGQRYRAEVSLERVGDRWQGRVPLPSGGAPLFTFDRGECGLFWELTCELAVPQRPDIVVVHRLFARPV